MKSLIFLSLSLSLSSCAPKVVVIDRQTVLQSESTGEFPSLDSAFRQRALHRGPKMLDRSELSEKEAKHRTQTVLNGELTREEK